MLMQQLQSTGETLAGEGQICGVSTKVIGKHQLGETFLNFEEFEIGFPTMVNSIRSGYSIRIR